jgi:hypothetical protein
VVGDVEGLKSIAELLGWGYEPRKIGGRTVRVAVTTVDGLLELLVPRVE